jgi:hypothetical protein
MLIPRHLKQVFHEDIIYLIRKEIEYLKSGAEGVEQDNTEFRRLYQHNNPFFKELHYMITDRVSTMLGIKVKPSYCFTSMYFVGEGFCPEHVDRPQCKYTLDICINQNYPWPIKIAGREYSLECNDAMLYSGTDHIHSRNLIQPDNYCDLVFFHFVPLDFKGPLD